MIDFDGLKKNEKTTDRLMDQRAEPAGWQMPILRITLAKNLRYQLPVS